MQNLIGTADGIGRFQEDQLLAAAAIAFASAFQPPYARAAPPPRSARLAG